MNVQNTEWFYPPKTEFHKCAGWFVRVEVLRYVVCGIVFPLGVGMCFMVVARKKSAV